MQEGGGEDFLLNTSSYLPEEVIPQTSASRNCEAPLVDPLTPAACPPAACPSVVNQAPSIDESTVFYLLFYYCLNFFEILIKLSKFYIFFRAVVQYFKI